MKRIGRLESENDIVIHSDRIGRRHATIEEIRNGEQYIVTDLGSVNGTFVNGIRLNKDERRNVTPYDKVMFAHIELDWQKITGKTIDYSLDFSKQFDLLKDVLDEYQKNLGILKKKKQWKDGIIRSLITTAPIALLYSDAIPKNLYALVQISCGIASVRVNIEDNRFEQAKLKIEESFRAKWRCPRCQARLPSNDWKYLKEDLRICPNCKVRW